MQDASLEQSDVDDISSMASGSMASDFPKFRAGRKNKRKRTTSMSGVSATSSGVSSSSSSEMAAIRDNDEEVREILRRHSVLRQNKVDMQT